MIDETPTTQALTAGEDTPVVPEPVKATYAFKTEPYPHQRKIFRESVMRPYVSMFLDVGLGKTKIIIDQASFLFQLGYIDALMVIAPNGVHRNWVSDEIPVHMPDAIREKCSFFIWQSSKADGKKVKTQREAVLKHPGLAVVVVSYEATITETFKLWKRRFLAKRRVMLVLDESHRIKKADGKIKIAVVAMGQHCPYRRILTGTPVEKPTDIYAQVRFLDTNFWPSKGLPTTTEFESLFCIHAERNFIKKAKGGGAVIGKNGQPVRNIVKQIVGYKNIDLLAKWVRETGYRMTLEDADIHLPPVTYSKRYHEMLPEQRRLYNELRDECRTVLESGEELVAEATITRLLRLQQIICGYVSTEAEQPVQLIDPKRNTRLEVAVEEVLADLPHQCLVWARFTKDIDLLMDALGKEAVRYDGQVDDKGRTVAKKAFQAGDVKYMVMSNAGAEGHTLVGAKTAFFYSNDYILIKRIQKEGRNHRIGQNEPVHMIDMVCEDTVDGQIIDALRAKFDIATQLVGSKLKEWL